MKRAAIFFIAVAAFVAGLGYGRWYGKTTHAGSPRQPLYWVDPMHPWYKSDKPGVAPDCNMQLVAVYPGEEQRYAAVANGTVQVSPEKQQLIGVEYGTAQYETVTGSIRAAARVTLDETRVAKVQTRLEGWIGQVFADFTGKFVRQGDPLLTIYSPDALATEQEFLLAGRARHQMHEGALPAMASSTDNLIAAARKRLELWDISPAQIDEIARTGNTIENLTITSPISGFVTERNAFAKQHVTPETVLYTLADLSTVWVVADVFEYESANVRLNQSATMTLDSAPGRVFRGRVSYILPQVDPATRTLKVRIAFDNPNTVLKPEMYGQVEIHTAGARRLVVPRGAVLDSGDRQTIFVDRGNGNFEPRQVRTGESAGDRVEILEGLAAGERIVTSGNFLIDSESQLNAATSGMKK